MTQRAQGEQERAACLVALDEARRQLDGAMAEDQSKILLALLPLAEELAWYRKDFDEFAARVPPLLRPKVAGSLKVLVDRVKASPRRTSSASTSWAEGLSFEPVVPAGYEIDELGVWQSGADDARLHVAGCPICVTALLVDVATGAQLVEVSWRERRSRAWTHRTIGREIASDARQLVAVLAKYGAPVHSGNARQIVSFLAVWCDFNPELPRRKFSQSTGWIGTSFLAGRTLLKATVDDDDVELAPDGVAAEVSPGIRSEGTWAGWCEAWKIAQQFPRVALGLYATMVPALLDLCPEIPSFGLSFAHPTSRGKTTTLRFAASAWGVPEERADGGLLTTWDTTLVALERRSAGLGGLPMLLDDTQRARKGRRGESEVGPAIYQTIQGRGRGRGTPGGVQTTATWRTVLVMTGEQSACAFSQDGGTRARLLELWGSPWGPQDQRETVLQFEGILRDNFGHLGPRVIRAIQAHAEPRAWLRDRFRSARAHWVGRAGPDSVAVRASVYVAALQVALEVCAEAGLEVCPEALEEAWLGVESAVVGADRALAALQHTRSVAVGAGASRWYGRHVVDQGKARTPTGGWWGTWNEGDLLCVPAWLAQPLRETLEHAGFPSEQILATWGERGWLEKTGGKRNQVHVKVDGQQAWAYRLTPEAWNLGG